MKKIIYGITILCLMFIGTVSVSASGGIEIKPETLEIVEGGTGSFNIIVENAIARAYITSSDTSILKINTSAYNSTGTLKSDGLWISQGGASGTKVTHIVPVLAVGKKDDTAKIRIEIFDATTYDEESLATSSKKDIREITVKIVEKPVDPTPTPTTKYTVTYNANGGKNAPTSQTKGEDETLTLSTSKPTKEGYDFVEWNTKADGSGASYQAGGKYDKNMNITLYAQWKPIENVDKNPNTGDTLIYIVLLLTLGALIYSYWYMKKSQEN